MSNLCGSCGHSITIHNLAFAGCTGELPDANYGAVACVCPHFELDNDD
jgi:hypothetical protein